MFEMFKSEKTLEREQNLIDEKIKVAEGKAKEVEAKQKIVKLLMDKKESLKMLEQKSSRIHQLKAAISSRGKKSSPKLKVIAANLGKIGARVEKATAPLMDFEVGNDKKKKKGEGLLNW